MLNIFEISPIDEKDVKIICKGACKESLTLPDDIKRKLPPLGDVLLALWIMRKYAEYRGMKKHNRMSSGGSCRRPGSIPGEGPDMLNRPSVRPSVRTMDNGEEKS